MLVRFRLLKKNPPDEGSLARYKLVEYKGWSKQIVPTDVGPKPKLNVCRVT